MDGKIQSEKELIKIISYLKNQGKKVVTYNGSFDLLHAGHIASIREAKAQGDVLVILLNSDTSVQSYKSSKRPIISQEDRAQLLAALEDVDYVIIFDDINPKQILAKIKPDIHCNGSDWGKDCVEREVVEGNGGQIYILKWTQGLSTSSLIKKIIEAYSSSLTKAIFLDRDGTINVNGNGYIHKKEDFIYTDKAIAALQKLSKSDYKIIIITNQSGVGRGYFTKEDVENLHKLMIEQLDKKGIRIDRIYFCPHHPDDGCDCRKPKIGMLMQAVKDFDISLNDSWMIGDDERDIIMSRDANLKAIKLGEKMSKDLKLGANFYAKDLQEATDIIL